MSKSGSNAGIAVSVLFNIAVWVAPGIKDEYRPLLFVVTIILLAAACVWWWFAHKAVADTSSGISINSRTAEDVLSAANSSTASKISTGAGNTNAPIAGRDIHYHAVTQAEEKEVHVYPQLTIDSLDQEPGHIAFHFDITNGNIAIENIQLHLVSKRNSYSHYGSIIGAMAPNGSISTLRDFIARTEDDHDIVTLTIYFRAKVGTKVEDLISRHFFEISGDKLSPGIHINPSGNGYFEGKAPSDTDRESIKKDWIDHLSRETGHKLFNALEKSYDGADNLMIFNVSNKTFIFDWSQRLVVFRITAPSGKVIDLRRNMGKSAIGQHIIAFGWRKTGGWLRVDDQDEIRKYDE